MLNMPKQSRTRLVPPKTEREVQSLETLEESNLLEQEEEPVLTELDNEIECPRCHEIMQLRSSFDKLVYSCESCSFLLRCV
jgi:hypothetical protein